MAADPAAERGHLQSAAQHPAVDLRPAGGTEPTGQLVERERGAVPGAGQVCACRVGEGAELAEVAAAAERRPVAGEHHLGDGVVEQRNRERLQQQCSRIGAECVVALGPVEGDAQRAAVALGQHRVGNVGELRGSTLGEPASELRAGLQRGVGQRFGDDRRQRRAGDVDRPQYVVAHRAGMRPPAAAVGQFGDGVRHRFDGDESPVLVLGVGEGECRCVEPELGLRGRGLTDRDHDSGRAGHPDRRRVGQVDEEHRTGRLAGGRRSRVLHDQLLLVQLSGIGARQLLLEGESCADTCSAPSDLAARPAAPRQAPRRPRHGRRAGPHP